MNPAHLPGKDHVHYRIGSLENLKGSKVIDIKVHYRIGSLENIKCNSLVTIYVHYRIGSLEIS